MQMEKKCPRCKSKRIEEQLGSKRLCRRCGQRWHKNGLLIPSFDKRSFNKDFVEPKEQQLPLIKL